MPKVVNIEPGTKLGLKEHNKACQCNRVYVVEKIRMLECRDCGKIIDAFDFMLREAKIQKAITFSTSHLRRVKKELELEVEELTNKKRHLKAFILNNNPETSA